MNKIKASLVEGTFLLDVIKGIDYYCGFLWRKLFFSFGKVKKNKIFIMTFDHQYTCNPKYIVDELLRQKVKCQIVWVMAKKDATNVEEFPKKVKLVKYQSAEMFEEMATSKIWIENALGCEWFNMPKKRSQVLLQTWHGSMGIKKLSGNKKWLRRAARAKKVTDYCITNSKFEEDVFRETFWPTTEFLKFGHARNDILMDEELIKKAKKNVYRYFHLDSDVKIALYAPTFRDDGDVSVFNLDNEALKNALEQKFGGKWAVFVRAHFKNRSKGDVETNEEYVYDASGYPDMQELMAAVNVGITDYSSWAYDFILTRKPMFIYAEDIANYSGGRGFYFPIESTPFAIAKDSAEMAENIKNFDDAKYQVGVDEFLKERGCYEAGNAAKQTVEFIKNIIQ